MTISRTYKKVDDDGGEYIAHRVSPANPWVITYPTGGQRFYGTPAQVTKLLDDLIAKHTAEAKKCSDE